jgi:hypothetical protein
MKKIISLIAFLSIAVLAQNEQYQVDTDQDQQEKVQKLIKAGLAKNKEEIQKESFSLSPADKEALYAKNRKKAAAGWAALDFGVGFGVGSYIQGDITFGITQSVLDGLGYTLYIYNIVSLSNSENVADVFESLDGLGLSFIILTSSRIMSWIFPFVHQGKYNRTLKAALNSNDFSYSIDPLIVPKDGMPAVGLAFNIALF